MPRAPTARYAVASALLLAAVGAVAVWLSGLSTPVDIAEPGMAQIDCMSYAPFHRAGESPFDPRAFVTPSRISQDLSTLRRYTSCVRTYSVDQGLDAVPAIAARLGMRVMMGVWIDSDPISNATETARALRVLRSRPAAVKAVVVGNEVMLRRDMAATELADIVGRINAETDIPVTYADVWEFWLRNPSLADTVDFITVHILPYWEDEPVGIDHAVAHVRDTLRRTAAEFPGRSILVGETGWPSAGRMRGAARPGLVEQARFVRGWVHAAADQGIEYNLIEAFDQPWKRRLEGAMGGSWGVLTSAGEAKFAWRDAVVAAPRAVRNAALASIPASLLCVAALWLVRRRDENLRTTRWPYVIAGLTGLLTGLLLPLQWHYLVSWNRDAWEWSVAGLYALLGVLTAVMLAPLATRAPPLPGCVAMFEGAWWARRNRPGLATVWVLLRGMLLFGCAYFLLLHLFDPRYRGFPLALYVLPTIALLVPWVLRLRVPDDALHERILGLVILLALPPMLWHETLYNAQAVSFSLLAALMGVTAVWPGLACADPDRPSNTRMPSRSPKAPSSTV